MAAQTPPIFLQAGSHPAEDVRRAFSALVANRGIATPTDLAVTQNGTPNMTVLVATGQVAIPGSEATYQGTYLCENRGSLAVTISAADATNPRRDLIVARVRDAGYSGATNSFAIEAVTGTAAASPVDPTVPANSWVLARVAVAAAATSITNANITDMRSTYSSSQYGLMATAGGTIICTSTTRPAAPFEGMNIYETDTDLKQTYTGSAWVPTAQLGAWTSYTPTLTQSGAVTKTVTSSSYTKVGRTVTYQFVLTVTGSGTGANAVTVSLPFTAANTGTKGGGLTIFDASASTFYTVTARLYDPTHVSGVPYNSANWIGATGFTAALAAGDLVEGTVTYEATS